jgi:predicted secreted protein
LNFGNGDKISGKFVIANYERSGNLGSQEDFSINLESAGAILFTIGA